MKEEEKNEEEEKTCSPQKEEPTPVWNSMIQEVGINGKLQDAKEGEPEEHQVDPDWP